MEDATLEKILPNKLHIECTEEGFRCGVRLCGCGHECTQDLTQLGEHVDKSIDMLTKKWLCDNCPGDAGEDSEDEDEDEDEICEEYASWGEKTIIFLEPIPGGRGGCSGRAVGAPPAALTWCAAQWMPSVMAEAFGNDLHIITRCFRSRQHLLREIILGELGPSLEMFRKNTTKKDGISVLVFLRPHETSPEENAFVCTPWLMSSHMQFGELCSVDDLCSVCEAAFGECLYGVLLSACMSPSTVPPSALAFTGLREKAPLFSVSVALDINALMSFAETQQHMGSGPAKAKKRHMQLFSDPSTLGCGTEETKGVISSTPLRFEGGPDGIARGKISPGTELLIVIVSAAARAVSFPAALSRGIAECAYVTTVAADKAAATLPLIADGKSLFVVCLDPKYAGTPASKRNAEGLIGALQVIPVLPSVYGVLIVSNSNAIIDKYLSVIKPYEGCPVGKVLLEKSSPRSWVPLLVYNLYRAIDVAISAKQQECGSGPSSDIDEEEASFISFDCGGDGSGNSQNESNANEIETRIPLLNLPPEKKPKGTTYSEDDLPLSANFREVSVLHMGIFWDVDFEREVMTGVIIYKTNDVTPGGASEFVLDYKSLIFEDVSVAPDGDGGGGYEPAAYVLTPYSISVKRPACLARFSAWVRIRFRTMPNGPSVIWRDDADGNPAVFTGASSFNNRSIMPCADSPAASVTYNAVVQVPEGYRVLMSAPQDKPPAQTSGGKMQYSFLMNDALPPSTIAIAIGMFHEVQIAKTPVPSVIYAPKSQLKDAVASFARYVQLMTFKLEDMLGPLPFKRADIAVMPPSFLPMGLQNPNITFLSHTMIAPDGSMALRLAHELAHNYFGLLISESDWYEQWLSEGFADYMSERILFHCLLLGKKAQEDLSRIGSLIRYRTLVNDLRNTDEAAHKLTSPEKPSDDVIKGCLRPVFNNIQYNMGYFLVRHLALGVGVERFDAFLRSYVEHFRNKLLTGKDALDFYFASFPEVKTPTFCTEAIQRWLMNTSLDPEQDEVIRNLCMCTAKDNPYLREVELALKKLLQANVLFISKRQKDGVKLCREIGKSIGGWFPTQVVLFLQMINETEQTFLGISTMKELEKAAQFTRRCADIRHGWCEIVVKNKYTQWYSDVERLIVKDQSMGLFIFGELLNGGKKERDLAKSIYMKVKDTQDPQIHASMVGLLESYGLDIN